MSKLERYDEMMITDPHPQETPTDETVTVDIHLTKNEVNLLRLASTGGQWDFVSIIPMTHRELLLGINKTELDTVKHPGVYTIMAARRKVAIISYENIFHIEKGQMSKKQGLPPGCYMIQSIKLVLKDLQPKLPGWIELLDSAYAARWIQEIQEFQKGGWQCTDI